MHIANMESWLKGLDRKIDGQDRKILLFLDNTHSIKKMKFFFKDTANGRGLYEKQSLTLEENRQDIINIL